MAGTRKAWVPMAEQIRLINECRQSGMTERGMSLHIRLWQAIRLVQRCTRIVSRYNFESEEWENVK